MGEHLDCAGAKDYIREIGGEVVLEERLIGEEFTLMAFVDGTHLVPMPLVQDHKRHMKEMSARTPAVWGRTLWKIIPSRLSLMQTKTGHFPLWRRLLLR